MNQKRLLRSVSFSGTGLHTGSGVTVRLDPVASGGIRFHRSDLEGAPEVTASVESVADTNRGTTLRSPDGVEVRTVEHLLSALSASGIEHCRVDIDGPELPALDGSALPYIESIAQVSAPAKTSTQKILSIVEPIAFTCPASGARYHAEPSDRFDLAVTLTFKHLASIPSISVLITDVHSSYSSQVGPARTFCFSSEIPQLREAGLIRGGSIDNAVVLYDGVTEVEELRQIQGDSQRLVPPVPGEAVAGTPLRFADEPARHKGLDFVGDLSLLGLQLRGSFSISKPGHTGNIAFARHLLGLLRDGDPAITVLSPRTRTTGTMDINQIRDVIPHRYPFLLVDRILEIDQEEGKIVGLKNVTANEPFFQGHFPDFPIMPGVLIVEAMAQTGGLLLKGELGDDDSKLAVFMGIREAKFRRPVVPGDSMRLELELTGKKFNTYSMNGKAVVDGKAVAQAEITVAVIDKGGESAQ